MKIVNIHCKIYSFDSIAGRISQSIDEKKIHTYWHFVELTKILRQTYFSKKKKAENNPKPLKCHIFDIDKISELMK